MKIQLENFETWEKELRSTLALIEKERVISRLWKRDASLWKKGSKEISRDLGWLFLPEESLQELPQVESFVRGVRKNNFSLALLLGMGGSSLAPEVFDSLFPARPGFLELEVLDTTDPQAISLCRKNLRPENTLFIVSSKSGTTVETLSLCRFFYLWIVKSLSRNKAGSHFVAITDPESPLEDLARRLNFRATFYGNVEVGGRFSALSNFGLVPASLKGIPLRKILLKSQKMARLCRIESPSQENPAALLGTALTIMAQAGRDKLTFLLSKSLRGLGFWLEQLLAESTGKDGKGLLPIVGEPLLSGKDYGEDRLFLHFRLENEQSLAQEISSLKESHHPLLMLTLQDMADIGSQFFLWEVATALIGFLLDINPFDQPHVSLAKKKTREMLEFYRLWRNFPQETPVFREGEISLFGDLPPASTLQDALKNFLSRTASGDYLGILSFLPSSGEILELLEDLRRILVRQTKLPVTLGIGPRYLHSTGQLHKGDRGNGLFIMLTAESNQNLAIPDSPEREDSSFSFGELKKAQALGDYQALRERGRRIIRFDIGKNWVNNLKQLKNSLPGLKD